MGSRKTRIGRLHKNSERKRQSLKGSKPGRPSKYHPLFPTPPSTSPPSISPPLHPPPSTSPLPTSLPSTAQTSPSLTDVEKIPLPSTAWSAQLCTENLQFVKLQKQPNPKQPVAVTHCILVKKDLTWQVSIHGHIASNDCAPFSTIPQHLTLVAIQLLLTVLDTVLVCAGHPDEHLVEMAKAKKGTLLSKNDKEVHAALDSTAAVYLNGVTYTETIRSTSCQLLVYGSKCTSCVAYRNTLRSIYNQWKRKKAATTYRGHTNTRFLNSPQKNKEYQSGNRGQKLPRRKFTGWKREFVCQKR